MAINPQRLVIPLIRQIVARPRLAELLLGRDRWGNPLGDERYSNPFPIMERIQADGPVVHRRAYQSWFVTGYDEIQTVISHKNVSASSLVEQVMDVPPYTKLTPETRAFFRSWMLISDEPAHGRLRRLVSKAFTPKRIAEMEPLVVDTAEELLAPLSAMERVDIVAEFNDPLPVRVITGMLGIPAERAPWLRAVVADVGLFFNPFDIWDPDRINRAVSELSTYFGALADQRRKDPQPDLLTALVEAQDDGAHLTREELIANVGLLAGAGFDTTAGAFGNFMLALYHHPDQRRLVMEQPDLWPNAIEELLRYDGPAAINQRFTTAAVDVGGRTIPAHSAVSLLPQAGNRDPRRYDNPADLRLDRESPKPLSFGHGIHYCLGAHLARLELRVGMNAFLDHFGAYTVDESSIEWRRTLAVRGPLKMMVSPGR